MPKPTIELPDVPDGWLDNPAATPPYAPDYSPPVSPSSSQDGILGGWRPKEWSLADSGLNLAMSPEDIETIDFSSGTNPPEPSPWLNGAGGHGPTMQPDVGATQAGNEGFYTGLTPYQPGRAAGYRTLPHAGSDWMQLDPPGDLEAGEHGSGYYTYGTDKSGRAGTAVNAQWGMPKTMQVIGAVADKLATGDQYTPFGVGNISLHGGADFSGPYGHRGHKDGLGIDVRAARTDGAQMPVSYKDPAYDQAATQRLVDAFRSTSQVRNIYFNDPGISGVQPWKDHDNHLHVQLKP